MRPYVISYAGQRVTIDLDHLIGISGPVIVNNWGSGGIFVQTTLVFALRDEPITFSAEIVYDTDFQHSERRVDGEDLQNAIRNTDGTWTELWNVETADQLKLAPCAEFYESVVKPLEAAWSGVLTTEQAVTAESIADVVRPVIGAVLLMRPDDPALIDPRVGVAAEVGKAVAKYLEANP